MTPAEFWRARSEGERRTLAAGGAAIALLLFIAFAWIPLERARARLEREVPGLRAGVAALARDAQEARRLRAMPAVTHEGAAPLSALAASVPVPAGSRLAPLDAHRVRLAAEDASFTALVQWLATTAPAQGLRVESARIEALAAPGRVRAEVTLAR